MMVQEEASKEQHQTSGKNSLKSTSTQERTPTMTASSIGTHSIPILASLYGSCRFAKFVNPFERTKEATLVPTVARSVTQGSKVRDHVLLSVIAMIKGTPLRTLVDSKATRSFIDEKLQLCPPL